MTGNPIPRVFKIGASRVLEDDSTAGLSVDEVRERLKHLYPELAHATHRELLQDGTLYVEFLPRPGRKG